MSEIYNTIISEYSIIKIRLKFILSYCCGSDLQNAEREEKMNKKITVIPYLGFKGGNCEEAVNAYINAFGGKIIGMSRWSEKNSDNPEQIGTVMHVEFEIGSTHMAGGDILDCAEVKTDISLMVHMDSEAEALHAISLLVEGGGILLQPLKPHPEPDDGGCGSLIKDRFGYTWIITCPNPAK